jgi:hypothetical protein
MTYVPLLREDYDRASTDSRRRNPPNSQETVVLMGDAGIDPLDNDLKDMVWRHRNREVVRTALTKAGSISSLMLTTVALVAEIPEEKKERVAQVCAVWGHPRVESRPGPRRTTRQTWDCVLPGRPSRFSNF